jgi:hypothetical protein
MVKGRRLIWRVDRAGGRYLGISATAGRWQRSIALGSCAAHRDASKATDKSGLACPGVHGLLRLMRTAVGDNEGRVQK